MPLMFLGDEAGYVSKWDLSPLMREFRAWGFRDVQSVSKYLPSFNPKKNAQIDHLAQSQIQIFLAYASFL